MIPDNVEKIVMTKEDYDRNVEQLLLEKINAEQEIERLNNILNELEKWLGEKQFERIDNIGIYALYETVLQKLQELKGSDK